MIHKIIFTLIEYSLIRILVIFVTYEKLAREMKLKYLFYSLK